MINIKNFAYITLATTPSYLKGAHLLHHSLKKVKSSYPLIIMIPEPLKETFNLQPDIYNYFFIPLWQFKNNKRYENTINKFQAFNFIEYEKIIFLDADVFMLENIDYIFHQYNSYEFLANWYYCKRVDDIDMLPQGDFLFLTPNQTIYNQFKDNLDYITETYTNDEKVMKYYLYPELIDEAFNDNINIFQNVGINLTDKIYHCGGSGKWFEILNIDPFLFCEIPYEELKNFFDFFHAYRGVKYMYNTNTYKQQKQKLLFQLTDITIWKGYKNDK